MAYTFQIDSFPYASGTIEEDQSIYLGNNRFFRIVSQSDPKRTMAAMYDVDDVYSSTPTITTLKEKVIDDVETYYRFKLCKLGSGDVLIVFTRSSNGSNTYYSIIGYDDANSDFNIEVDTRSINDLFDSEDNLTSIYRRGDDNADFEDFSIFPYENSTVLMSARSYDDNDYEYKGDLIRINDIYADNSTDANVIVYTNDDRKLGIHYSPVGIINKIIDGYWFFNSNSQVRNDNDYEEDNSAYLIDLNTDTVIYSSRGSLNDIVKLDTERFAAIGIDGGGELSYDISDSIESATNHSTVFDPKTQIFNRYDEHQRFYTYPLDRFHCLVFFTTANNINNTNNELYCNVLKIKDENWGDISPATLQNGIGYELLPTVFSGGNKEEASRVHNTNVLEFIDNTHFFVQTGFNTYEFVEISPASSS